MTKLAAEVAMMPVSEHEAEMDRMRRLVKVVSCRCAAQIAEQRIENRQRSALTELHKMALPFEAALIVERALYDTGGKEPSPAPFLESGRR